MTKGKREPGKRDVVEVSGSRRDFVEPWMLRVGISLGLLGIYIISIGPMYWLASRGAFGEGPIFWLADVYAPIWWLKDTFLRDLLHWYVQVGMK